MAFYQKEWFISGNFEVVYVGENHLSIESDDFSANRWQRKQK